MLLLVVLSLISLSFQSIEHAYTYRHYFGESHQKFADTLLDYGFFLSNVDDIVRSVQAYTVSQRTTLDS